MKLKKIFQFNKSDNYCFTPRIFAFTFMLCIPIYHLYINNWYLAPGIASNLIYEIYETYNPVCLPMIIDRAQRGLGVVCDVLAINKPSESLVLLPARENNKLIANYNE